MKVESIEIPVEVFLNEHITEPFISKNLLNNKVVNERILNAGFRFSDCSDLQVHRDNINNTYVVTWVKAE